MLLVLSISGVYEFPSGQKDIIWLCSCDCGKKKNIRQSSLASKTRPTLSCGCLRATRIKANPPAKTHGESRTRLYRIWRGMKNRTLNLYEGKDQSYHEKGITVCDEWLSSYETFRDWAIENGYKKELTIDRINPMGHYAPGNCRFTTMKVQQNNRTNNKRITAWGESKTLAQWLGDPRCQIGRESLKCRLNFGWNAELAISMPPTKSFYGNQHK
ncbi:MAG: hypothetical protein ACRCYP_03370 [Alphaproteobacteria bacterium]